MPVLLLVSHLVLHNVVWVLLLPVLLSFVAASSRCCSDSRSCFAARWPMASWIQALPVPHGPHPVIVPLSVCLVKAVAQRLLGNGRHLACEQI
jgi:hypothetical protein